MPKNVSIVAETLLFNLYHTFRQRIKNGENRIEAIRFSKPLDESLFPDLLLLELEDGIEIARSQGWIEELTMEYELTVAGIEYAQRYEQKEHLIDAAEAAIRQANAAEKTAVLAQQEADQAKNRCVQIKSFRHCISCHFSDFPYSPISSISFSSINHACNLKTNGNTQRQCLDHHKQSLCFIHGVTPSLPPARRPERTDTAIHSR